MTEKRFIGIQHKDKQINISMLETSEGSHRPNTSFLYFWIVESRTDILSKLFSKSTKTLTTSINDLRDKEFSGQSLSSEERFALSNFDKYRIKVLNSQESEEAFHEAYRKIQVIANLGDWRDFLNEDLGK